MQYKTLIHYKTALVLFTFVKGGLMVARNAATSAEASREVMIYREYSERLIRLEEAKNIQFAVLLLLSLVIVSFLLYKIYVYRRLLRQYGQKDSAVSAPQPSSSDVLCVNTPAEQPSGQASLQTSQDVVSACSNEPSIPVAVESTVLADQSAASTIDPKLLELASRIERLMQEEHLYRESFLTRDRVAALLETNRTYIGQVMSEIYHESFSQYINNLRVNEAIAILDNPAGRRPIRLIGRDLGFNSVTTFNAQFQKRTGMTPAQYRQNVIESQKE